MKVRHRVLASFFVVYVLVPAAAFSDCAWVLWNHSQTILNRNSDSSTSDWRIAFAVPLFEDCEKQRRQTQQDLIAQAKKNAKNVDAVRVVSDGFTQRFMLVDNVVMERTERFVCLPDTVDPRPPNTAGR